MDISTPVLYNDSGQRCKRILGRVPNFRGGRIVGELIDRPNGNIAFPEDGDKVLSLSDSSPHFNFNAFLGDLSQCVYIGDVLAGIKAGTRYVVEVPNATLQAGLDAGKYFVNQNAKTGVTWPTLVEILPNGKKKFVANLPIKEQSYLEGSPFQGMSQGLYSAAIQAQLAEIKHLAQATLENTQRILQGQKDDRIGHLQAGYERFFFAMNESDPAERDKGLNSAIDMLLTARSEIGATLRSLVNGFDPISKNVVARFFARWSNTGAESYYDQKDAAVNEIVDHLMMYINATIIISSCYRYQGKERLAEIVFDKAREFLSGIDWRNVRTIQYAHKDRDLSRMNIYRPAAALEEGRERIMLQAKEYDYIEIELEGHELKEAITSEGAGAEPETQQQGS